MLASEFPSLADYNAEDLIAMADEHDDTAFAAMLENHKEIIVDGNFYQLITGLMNPFANMLFGMAVPDAAHRVKTISTRIKEMQVPAFWWVGPRTTPTDLDKELFANGWIEGSSAPAMVIDLEKLSDEKFPKGLKLHAVTNGREMFEWQSVFGKGYELPSDVAAIINPTIGGPMKLFTATLDGTPVGTTALYTHKGVPGIYCVSTIREFRGRGIGAAITAMPLMEARQEGYRVGTLQASSMGHPVYRRIGFEDVCHLRVFAMNM